MIWATFGIGWLLSRKKIWLFLELVGYFLGYFWVKKSGNTVLHAQGYDMNKPDSLR